MKDIILQSLFFILITIFASCDEEVSRTAPNENVIGAGEIAILTNPPGSQIYLDGRNYGSTTPDTLIWIDSGLHQITLKRNLFKNVTFTVNVTKDTLYSIFYDYFTDPQHYGSVYCHTYPYEAEIFINDINTNKITPETINNLIPGNYFIRFKKNNYLDKVVECVITADMTTSIYASLVDTSQFITYNKEYFNCPDDYQTFVLEDISRNTFWIGTSMNGILKFNNMQWTNYSGAQYNLHSNNITSLKLDNQNNLWICNYLGIVKFDGINWTDYSSFVGNNYVSSIDFDSKGNAWIGTRNGIFEFDGINWTHYYKGNTNIPSNYISDIEIDKNDVIWIGTESHGVIKLENNIWTNYTTSDGLLYSSVFCIEISESGKIYLGHFMGGTAGTYGGISIFDNGSWTTLKSEVANLAIRDIKISNKSNNVWIVTDRNGIILMDSFNRRKYFNSENSWLPSNDARSLIIDKDDNIWISTFGGGLTKFKKGDLYIIQN